MLVVGVADIKTTTSQAEVLVTYSLGSCLGIVVHDPVNHVAGMLHCMLPTSQLDKAKSEAKPAMFTDSGMMELLKAVYKLGAERKNLVVVVAGGASILDAKKLFNIGERNFTILRKILWKNNLLMAASDVGGSISRTVYHRMADGRTIIRSGGQDSVLYSHAEQCMR